MASRILRLVYFLVVLALAAPGLSAADRAPEPCSDPLIRVAALDREEEQHICRVAERAKRQLASCGMIQTHRVDILVAEEPTNTLKGAFLAAYLPKKRQIEIYSRNAFATRVTPESDYTALPPYDVYDSLLVHEMAHALYIQTACGRDQCLAAHEYIASAMQIASLPKEIRQSLLAPYGSEPPATLDDFNEFMLALDPVRFAALAYDHFAQPENGCAFIGKIITLDVVFPEFRE